MLLSEITWVQAEEYFRHNDMVIIPIGSIECHGKHMPLGTDTLIPDKIIELVRKEKDDVLIAPTVPYGACESLYPFPGTVNLGTDLLYQLMKTIIWNLKRHGARKFVILNGHGGNIKALERIGITDIDPSLPCSAYGMEDRKLIEIARAMYYDPKVLIVDETTTALAQRGRSILYKLISNTGKVFSREQLLDDIWGFDFYGDMRTVDSHVARLRTKLGEWGSKYIKTIYGTGYKIEAE